MAPSQPCAEGQQREFLSYENEDNRGFSVLQFLQILAYPDLIYVKNGGLGMGDT